MKLPKIELFAIVLGVELEVNAFVKDTFLKTGSVPKIKHSGEWVSVIWEEENESNTA